MSANKQRWLKLIHVLSVCLWLGGGFSLGSLHYLRFSPESVAGALFGLDKAASHIDLFIVIISGAVPCLLTGLIYSIFTNWGFFKHRWVTVKWILTLVCIITGTFLLGPLEKQMVTMSHALGDAALLTPDYEIARRTHFIFGNVQRALLIFMLFLSFFKPWKKKNALP